MMGWLQGNPIGAALAGLIGFLVIVSVGLGLAWKLPPSSGDAPVGGIESIQTQLPPNLEPMKPVESYAVVLERPVFNESRRPEAESGESVEELVAESSEQAGDPGVRLTGVVMTPEEKIVMLTPQQGEPLIAREGTVLEGDQLGWSVSAIDARQVTLSSRDGRELQLDLVIHDQVIAEPPKPEPVSTEEAQAAQGDEDGQPMSRAEEIRQRIQERREQLRQEALEAESDQTEAKAAQRTSYQEAIRAMMNKRNNQQGEESGEDDKE